MKKNTEPLSVISDELLEIRDNLIEISENIRYKGIEYSLKDFDTFCEWYAFRINDVINTLDQHIIDFNSNL